LRRIERALISVHDKTGVVEFARGLAQLNVEIVSTGGTAKLISSAGIPIRDVSSLTGFPEILDGRVKTINPKIAAALLAIRDNSEHMRQIRDHDVPLIDLVCVNLYPFVETTQKPGVRFYEVIENIDIGGPSMLRAASKNFQDVAVVSTPDDYEPVLKALRDGQGRLDNPMLFDLARKAFLLTARYDAQISQYLSQVTLDGADFHVPENPEVFPPRLFMDVEKVDDLRYGENPHQKAAFYKWGGRSAHGFAAARQLQGKELSYNNLLDLEAAWSLVQEFSEPACCIVKHTNPCGTAVASSLRQAYVKAYEADPTSAFGSIIAFNRVADGETAAQAGKLFVEAIIAPGFESGAMETLGAKKNLRLIVANPADKKADSPSFNIRHLEGGILLQTPDDILMDTKPRVVTERRPTEQETADLNFAWRVAKHVKSNAIVLVEGGRTVGVGAGQMSRVDSVKLSVQKASPTSKGAVLASDAFFPFRDGIDEAAKGGVTAIIQPGGSVRDAETIQAANEHGMAMVFTGIRHFRH